MKLILAHQEKVESVEEKVRKLANSLLENTDFLTGHGLIRDLSRLVSECRALPAPMQVKDLKEGDVAIVEHPEEGQVIALRTSGYGEDVIDFKSTSAIWNELAENCTYPVLRVLKPGDEITLKVVVE
jgi:hypothetical protein